MWSAFSDIIVNPAEYASELHVDALHPATYHMQDENYIDKAHGRGLRAHVWTVNEKHEMKALVKAEADAIITNYPDIAVEIVKMPRRYIKMHRNLFYVKLSKEL